jgi:hypothetical protein
MTRYTTRAQKDARNAKLKQKRDATKLLRHAQGLLIGPNQDGKGWTKGALAKNAYGSTVEPDNKSAVCFCSVGAIRRARVDLGLSQNIYEIANDRLTAVMKDNIVGTNDAERTTFPQVLMAFDLAAIGAP